MRFSEGDLEFLVGRDTTRRSAWTTTIGDIGEGGMGKGRDEVRIQKAMMGGTYPFADQVIGDISSQHIHSQSGRHFFGIDLFQSFK